mgnify:CR=1 FL=1
MELGPGSKTQPYNGSLLKFMTDCQKYTAGLSLFNRYILWRYSIGSGAINFRLIFGKDNPNATYWVYLFFEYYKNTINQGSLKPRDVKASEVSPAFREFLRWFNSPKEYSGLHIDDKAEITNKVIALYINELQAIMLKGPMVKGEGFTVFKTSTQYPGLPEIGPGFKPTVVPQIPFNSSTVMSDMNFYVFQSPEGNNYMWQIFIPPGTRGPLFIDEQIHAYSSMEKEVLLPHGVNFDVRSYSQGILDYVDPAKMNVRQLQNPKNISMGPVYELNEFVPIKNNGLIKQKPFNIFNAILR